MNQKTILILGAATVGAVALTASLQSGRADDTRPASTAAPLLPALKERVNDVRELRIESPAGPATLRAEGDGWVLAEASGYPADGSKVRTLLLDLRDARRLEAKTANPERHGRLGLTAPTDEGAVSTRVTLVDGDGGVIETVLIGKQRTSKADPGAAPSRASAPDSPSLTVMVCGGAPLSAFVLSRRKNLHTDITLHPVSFFLIFCTRTA